MEKLLLSLSNFLRDIKKIQFVVLFLLSTSIGLAQTITTSKTVTANPTNCGIVNVKVDITGANPITRNSDVILAIDISGSMGNTIPGDLKTSMDYAKDAALAFLNQAKANPQNRIAIVAYSTTATLKIGLTYLDANGVTLITNQINSLQATNSTNIYAGIVRSETELEANGRFDCNTARAIILLTDGIANVTGTNGNTSCNVSKTSQCVTDAINAATNAKTTTKSSVVYNNQVFSVGLFGGISGNINTNNSDQNIAKYTLDNIQGSAAYITQSGANLTSIYNQIATQISWVAQSLVTKETIIPGFTIGSITTSKGTASLSGQVITWNTDFLNSETITLNYQLTPTGSACGNQTVSTSTLNYQNSSCANDSKAISSPSYFVPCPPVITGTLTACGSTTLTATTNAASPTYVWYKDNTVINGQTSSTLTVTASGVYKVKVKNGTTNCELTSADSNVTISPAAALVAPANASISGCSTAAITGLPYSTASTNITLAQLNSAGGSLSNSGSIGSYTISYSDTSTGTCPITVTRTFKVTTSCGNVTAVQTITINDTTAPTWTTAANSLNVTLECSNTAGLTAAQNQAPTATDNCGGTVTYTKTSGAFTAGSCANSGTYTNTWTAKDVCNNTSTTFTQVITIQDTTAPTWTTAANSLNVTLECSNTAGLTAAQNQAPTATDNCGGTVTYTKTSGAFTAGSCVNSGTYTNTWTAKDVCNNTSTTFTQVITIQDTTAPTWTTAANSLNVTLECSNTAGFTAAQNQAPTATDNCGGTVTYTKTSGAFTAGICVNSGTYTNTWTAKDVCNNTSTTFTQVITIQDTTAPTWTTAANSLNVTLECSNTAGLTAAQNQAPTATDNCGGTVTYTKTSGAFTAGICVNSGTYTNTWTAKDVCNNTSTTFTQVITIQDTTAPTWTTTAGSLNVTLECSDNSGLTNAQVQFPVASDLCDNDVSNIEKVSGQFAASPSCGNFGTYTNTWTVKDDCGNISDTFTQVITIQDTSKPVWTTPAGSLNVTLECSDNSGLTNAQALFPVAYDDCGSGVINIVKVGGQFVASQGCGNAGTYTNTWTVKDDCGNMSDIFTQVITIQDTTAPTWTTQAGSLDVTLGCSDVSGLANAQAQFPAASDLCDADVSNITKVSGQFTASLGCGNAGTYTNTWTVKDDCGNMSDIFTQVITIQDTTAPTWTTQAGSLDVTLECSDASGLANAQAQFPAASDLCDADVSNIIKVSGQFTASAGCGNAGTYTNTWTVKDDCGNTSDTFTQVITIQDTTAPTWTTQAGSLDVTLECSDASGLANAQAQFPAASDLCDADVSNITKVSGQFTASQGCGNAGTYTNTWTVKDDCGNTSDTFTQVITIQDTTAPTWTTQAGSLDVTLECSDASGLANAQAQFPAASDLCDADVSNITKVSGQFTASAGCGNAGTYTNTWTVKDDCGNTSDTFTQVITIQDTTAPSWTTQAGSLDVTLECSDASGLANAQAQFPAASDLCDADVSNITKVSGQFTASQGCGNAGTYTNTWTVKDDCGNTSDTFTQVITIQDTTAPTWTTQAGSLDVTLECSDASGLANAQAQFPAASDLCDADVSNITKVSGQFTASAGCGNAGTYTNTWTVKDDCGNTSDTFTQVITIQDTTAPSWTTQAGSLDVTLECSDASGLANAQAQFPAASDLCDADVSNITKVSGQFTASAGCGNAGTYTNTWTVKDDCGNTSDTFTQVITIQDTTAPAWTTPAGSLDVTLECSDASGLANTQAQFPAASDLCDADVSNITKVSGQFVASAGCGNAGTYTNTWTVKDDCGNTSETFIQVITIQDTTAPAWTTPAGSLDVTLECSDASGLANAQAQFPAASDLCDADVSNITKVSGQFTASQGCGNAGTYTNTWTVTDDCGNTSDTFTQVITIQDTTAPAWTTQAGSLDVTLQCSDTEGFNNAQNQAPTATDNCNGDITYTKISGELQKGSCGSTGTYTNTWTAKDLCNNTSTTFTQVITIQDTAAPTWITQAGTLNVTLQCSDTAGLQNAQNQAPAATANCSIVTYEKTSGQFTASEGCGNSGTYTNSWIAKDDCGNVTDSFVQIITIEDTTSPTWTTQAGSLNATIECSDASGLANAQALFPTASDLCDADVSNIEKVSGQFVASEGCGNSGTYTNTWTVKDDCGNTSDTFTQIITIQDTTAPAWTTQAGSLDVTLECSDASGLANAQAQFPAASDLCDADVSNITKVSGQFTASQGCGNAGTYTNTWTVKDDCGNTSDTFTQVITIQDTTAPSWTTQAGSLNQTIECSNTEALAAAQALFPTASDACDADVANIEKVSGQFTASEGCGNAGTYTNTWTVKDDCGNTSETFTQVITIQDKTAPTWTTQAGSLNQTIECSNTEALASVQALFPTASDLCDADVSNIEKVSGQFIASEGCGNTGTYTNTWTVKDDCGNTSDTFTQIITIQDTTAPTWTTQAGSLNQTIECSNTEALATAQALFPAASDLCDADVSNITKVSGQFIASEGCGNAGTYTNTWTVKDDCGNTSETFTQVITIQDTTAPIWTTQAGSLNQTIECSNTEALASAQALFPTASDACDTDVSNIEKVSGQFTSSEGCGNAGTYTNTWTVKDDCGNTSDTFTQVITIQDTTAPTWTTQSGSLNVTLECSDVSGLVNAQAQFPAASDLCDSDVSNIEKVSGQFIASEGCGNAGTYTNTWTVKDDCGNTSDTFTQVITIQDTTAPTWTTQAGSLNQTIECSNTEALASAQALFPTASDTCDADVSNITKVSGEFVASEGCGNSGTYINTWTVKDGCGNTSDTFTQVITIQDTTSPTWTTLAGSLNQTIECSNSEALASAQALFPTASDTCDADVSNIEKISGQFVASEGCGNSGTYTNTWNVKDDCGNTSETFTQVITIQDTTAPSWTTQAGSLNQTIECSNTEALASAQALFPTASDLCDTDVSNIEKVSGQFVASEGCGNAGTYTNTWTVKDDCGNTSDTFTQVIIIQDTTAPAWTTQAGSLNQTIECSNTEALASAQALFPTASDACDADVSNIEKISGQFVASEGCGNSGTYTNTWTVKDDCGNTSETFTQVITIQDTTSPAFIGNLPTDITVSCDAVPEPANLEVSDNCNGNLPIVFSETKSDILNECGTDYTLTRKWTTSDCGGNVISHTQTIIVKDTTPPTGTAPADVAGLQSVNEIPAASPQDIIDAADNCSNNVTITISDSNNGASGCDGNAYVLTRTYTLTDCSGNKTELVQTFTVENKVFVTGIASNATCFGKSNGSILVTSSPGAVVVIKNAQNEIVGNTNLPAGTYTLTATAVVNGESETCTATTTVVITQPEYTIKISGYVINVTTNTGIANVPITLIPQGSTTGPILLRLTGVDGSYNFTGMPEGSYLVQVQDANLNNVYQLYPVNSSLFFTTLEDCKFQEHNFEYGPSNLPVLGDYVWYDTNSNGIQDEWYDANNDGVVTKNVPDENGAIDYSLLEWIDLNGDGSYQGPSNSGELNAGGFGNALSPNVIVDGPNGYHKEVIIGIQGYWRDRPASENPYGNYNIKLVKDANLDAMANALGETGLVKVLPNAADKKVTAKKDKTQLHTVCSTTTAGSYIVTVTPEDLVHLDADFGISCKKYQDIVANDDSAGPIAGVNHTTTNVLNVLLNDTLEGNPVTASEVIVTTVTPNEFLQLNPDGSLDVLPNAPTGTLTLVYQICEADQTSNCDTATVTITIEAPVMTVTATAICVNDVPYVDYSVTPVNFTPINGVTIAWANAQNTVITTMTNLPLSGRVLWPGALVDESGNGIDWPGWVFQNNKWIQAADGFESLRPTVNLTISVNPSETITINYPPADPYCTARPTFAIVANDDNPPAITAPAGVTNITNVFNNDTLNNDPVNPNDVTLTIVTPDPTNTLTLNPDGSVDVAPNVPAGTYTLTYQICENADAGNCDTAIVTVVVLAAPTPVAANDDVYDNIGCYTFGLIGNVLSNDFKGQVPATLELVNFTLLAENQNDEKTDPNIVIDNSGNVTVSGLTPPGTYTYSYRICDKLDSENCDNATITITVVPNGITNITSQACNDDSSLVNLSNLLPEGTPITGTWIDTNNSNALVGSILNPFGLTLGNYTFEYQIVDENCPRSILLNMEINDDCRVLACGNILVHNAFSPNGDGINDVFVIDSIDDLTCYPGNTVEIYNRWGILVFETTNYNNTTNAFDGKSRGRTTVKQSDGLPTGTYFYILNYKSLDGNNVIQNNKQDGYLYLSK